ncbi:YolD-like family protein [Bacillus sp. FJAT-29790]|uniref:YolD-like family protein n=1 Tax=Bacillus sp. FJAT-29790 TaxID=1895002 RepID=UPI001C218CAA|nr:YolD-like family protein [Bacillus sp. FJAT-29790]MBU8879236.1 YolD-like family protein [Bacillus sp. FJAT-29790]
MAVNKLSKGYNLRWESSRMMLPEHREQLLGEKRKQQEFKPPLLDNDQLQEINCIIIKSIEQKRAITITYAEKYGPAEFWGWIQKVDTIEGWLKIINEEDILILSFKRILQVEIS